MLRLSVVPGEGGGTPYLKVTSMFRLSWWCFDQIALAHGSILDKIALDHGPKKILKSEHTYHLRIRSTPVENPPQRFDFIEWIFQKVLAVIHNKSRKGSGCIF